MIPFNKPYMTGKELWYIAQAHAKGHLAGDGEFTKKCQEWIQLNADVQKALLTHSCTAALEMAAILSGIKPGDEVIMPSYTFVSTANAFVLRGAIPVFIDIRKDTLNIDEGLIEQAITPKTKAIVLVHYAGVSCNMDAIMYIAKKHDLIVIEDAAQGVGASYKGKALGSFGDLGTYSFHETKNIISGEGGALLVNNKSLIERAEIIREKGTDRNKFFRGEVDKYTWQDIGSSFLPSELVAAFLWAQMEEVEGITKRRIGSWSYYNDLLIDVAVQGKIRLPIIPAECKHNAHMYYVLINSEFNRNKILGKLRKDKVGCIFHYVPLHSSPAGQKYCRVCGKMDNTEDIAARLIRLPLWVDITPKMQEDVVKKMISVIG